MPRRRPTAVTVIAILHLVFGGLGLLCGICSGILDLAPTQTQAGSSSPQASQQARKEITEQVLSQRVPLYRAYTIGNRVSGLLTSVLLVAAGIGLLQMQSWARWLSVVYAVLSLLVNLVGFVYTVAFFTPAYAEVFRQLPPQNDQERMASDIARVTGPAIPCLVMIYPVAVLIVMLLPSVGAAFRPRKKRLRSLPEDV
jgi:uncharacterized protein involved in cysteine biosynthesis